MSASTAKYDVFSATANPTRRQMLKLLGSEEMSLLLKSVDILITRTAVNKHLHILSDAGLVSRQKVGRETRYQLQPEPLRELQQWLAYYEQFWDNKLAMLKHLVENDDPSLDTLRLVRESQQKNRSVTAILCGVVVFEWLEKLISYDGDSKNSVRVDRL